MFYSDKLPFHCYLCQPPQEKDVLVWSNSDKRLLVVSKEGHDDVRKYWKKKKKRKEEGKDLDDDV